MSLPYLQDLLHLEADQYLQREIADLLVPFEQGNNAVTLGPSSMAYSLLQQLKAAIFEERRHENRLRFVNSFLADVAVTRRIRREDVREPKPQADVSDVSGEPAAHSEPVPRMTPMPQVIKSKSLDKAQAELNSQDSDALTDSPPLPMNTSSRPLPATERIRTYLKENGPATILGLSKALGIGYQTVYSAVSNRTDVFDREPRGAVSLKH